MKDSEVLEKIGDFMAKTYVTISASSQLPTVSPGNGRYHDKQLLTGIIYMHRITDVRFSGVAKKNFRVFRKLCGPNAMKNLIICTNMWPNPSDPADPIHLQLESREEELRTSPQIFQPAMAEGARMTRYTRHKGPTHAQEIVRLCLANIPVATLYQEEVSRGARLGDTSAGRVLEEDMQRLIKDHKAEIARLVRDHEEAIRKKDEVTRREIQEEREEREKALAKLNENIVALKKSLGDANRKGEEDRVRYEKSQQERDEKIKQLEAKIAGLRERLEIETDPGVIARLKQQIDDSLGKIKNLCWDWFY
ncbi:hypothetical protein FRC11_012929 [Ceratobasidium sp. 423]|nr:hypothetical protein FRC11_012929 [Ceratobasidium sp. 423]